MSSNGASAYGVVIGVADPGRSLILRREVDRHPRFRIVGTADNAVMTVHVTGQAQPDVVVLSDESPGVPGRSVVDDLTRVSPKPLVIVMTAGDPGTLAQRDGITTAVNQDDLDAITQALESLADFLDNPDHEQPERRARTERRVHQDWTKVFAERRVSARRQD